MRQLGAVFSKFVLVALLAGCSAVPRVELTAYTTAYAEILTITNDILAIVSPYERIVIRNYATSRITVPPRGRAAFDNPSFLEAHGQLSEDPPLTAPRSTPSLPRREDPALTAPRSTPSLPRREDPALTAPRSTPSLPRGEDPSLTAPRSTPSWPRGEDPSLRAPRSTPSLPREEDTSVTAPRSTTVRSPTAGAVRFIESPCRRTVAGEDPFCYEMRDGYADIGDPPLVAAHRNLANVVLRFNTLLIAYAEGVTGRLLQQEIADLSTSVIELSNASPVASISSAAAFARSFSVLVEGLAPITKFAGGFIDRAELRYFLLANYETVDEAIGLMARNSVELYGNVVVGTSFFIRASRSPAEIVSLGKRRKEIRRLISNWTVLLDDTRRLLRELKIAIEISDGLETRMHNLEGTVRARIDTSAIKKQIATLGAPTLPP